MNHYKITAIFQNFQESETDYKEEIYFFSYNYTPDITEICNTVRNLTSCKYDNISILTQQVKYSSTITN